MPIITSSGDFFHSLWRQQFAAFCLFVRTLPIDFALLGWKWKNLKSKTTAKLREKRTSIAAVRDILWTFGTFPTPFLSRYRLPLKVGGGMPLFFVYFHIFVWTLINEYNTIIHHHLSSSIAWGLSRKNLSMGCRAENWTRACLTASRCATNFSTSYPFFSVFIFSFFSQQILFIFWKLQATHLHWLQPVKGLFMICPAG